MAWILGVFWEGVQVEVLARQEGTSKMAQAIFTSPPLKHGRCFGAAKAEGAGGELVGERSWNGRGPRWTHVAAPRYKGLSQVVQARQVRGKT